MWRFFVLSLVWCCGAALAGESKTVRDFGAVGDGKTDDSAAIQRAVESGIGGVVFPKGVYLIGKTVTVKLDQAGVTSLMGDGSARVVMAGSGPAFLFLGTHQGSADPAQMTEQVREKERMPVVKGLEIVGAHEEADGIEANGVVQLTITECRVQRVRHALTLVRRNRNVLVSNCHFYENRGCGVLFDRVNLHQFNITGSHVSYNAGGGIVLRGGEVRNVHIGTCDIESNMRPEGEPTANILIDCREGSTAEVAVTGCTIQHNSKSPGSANIRVLGRGVTSGKNPQPTQEGHITITGNVFSDVMVNVHLDNVRGATVVGNTFWEGFEHDLLVENSQAIVVGPNDFDRNPRYVVNGNWAKDKNGLVFRHCQDSKLNGFLVKGVWDKEAAVLLEKCDRMTVSDVSVLDCDGVGLWLLDSTRCVVSQCLIRDDREERKSTVSFKATGGKDNWVRGNWFGNGREVADGVAVMEGNR
jgi:hypothetical protein